jgi:hypothetical protein
MLNTSARTTALKFFLMLFSQAQAQHTLSDTLNIDSVPEKLVSYFLIDLGYTNNSFSNKNIQTTDISAAMADVSFYHTSGVWASLMPVAYANANTPSYDFDALAGYQHFFNNGFDINAYYLYHNYSGDSSYMGINYKHSFNVSVGYSYGGLYAYAGGYNLMGESDNYFANLGLGYYKEFYLGKHKKDYISIFPLVSFTFGTDYWVYDGLSRIDFYTTQRSLKENGYSSNTFDFQSVDAMIPLSFTHKNSTVLLTYLYTLPTQKYSFLGWENQSGLIVSYTYLLKLKK